MIVSTQSAQLLNEFDPEDVIVVERTQGESVFRRLDSAQLSGWLEDYTLGELWQKNVLGGGPRNEEMPLPSRWRQRYKRSATEGGVERWRRASMTRVHVVVEGLSERSFVNNVLAPALWRQQVYLNPIVLGFPGHKGGNPNYARVQKDVLRQLKRDPLAYCSTMLDFYGLGKGFPGTPLPPNLSNLDKVTHIEQAVREDIITQAPDLRAEVRFIPYLQLHEFEGLLFSDPAAFARSINQSNLASQFQSIREGFPTPEDIDDSPNHGSIKMRAPSLSFLPKGAERNASGSGGGHRHDAARVPAFS